MADPAPPNPPRDLTIDSFLQRPLSVPERMHWYETLRLTPAEIEAWETLRDPMLSEPMPPDHAARMDLRLEQYGLAQEAINARPPSPDGPAITREDLALAQEEAILEEIERLNSRPERPVPERPVPERPVPEAPRVDPFNDPDSILHRPQPGEGFVGRPPGAEPLPGRPGAPNFAAPDIAAPDIAAPGPSAPGRLATTVDVAGKALAIVLIVDGLWRDGVHWTTGQDTSHGIVKPVVEQMPIVEQGLHWFTENSPFFSGIIKVNDGLSHTWGAVAGIALFPFQLAEVAGTQIGKLGNELIAIAPIVDRLIDQEISMALHRLENSANQALNRLEHRIDQAADLVVAVAENPMLPLQAAQDAANALGNRIDQALGSDTAGNAWNFVESKIGSLFE